jgi:transmembrane sensor
MTHDTQRRLDALISEQAAEWFIEFRLGDIDRRRRREFDGWLRASPEHLRAYLEVAAIWHESGSLETWKLPGPDELMARAGAERKIVSWGLAAPGTANDPTPEEARVEPEKSLSTAEGCAARIAGSGAPPSSEKVAAAMRSWMGRLSLAAAILLALTLLGWHELRRAPLYSTQVGEQRSLRLPDGSTVELNSRSRLRVQFSRSLRVVELIEGQALFHVAKNPARPFIVRSAQTSVRAVGTRFDVYKRPSRTVVTVLEGSVAVSGGFAGDLAPSAGEDASSDRSASSDSPLAPSKATRALSSSRAARRNAESEGVLLSAGEQVAVTQLATGQPIRANLEAATAWTQRRLILDNAPLSEVADEFNRYSSRKLVTEDHGEPALKLSGVFSTDPDFLIRYLRERHDIVVSETGAEVRIVRQPNP